MRDRRAQCTISFRNAFWATRYTEEQDFDCEFWTTQMLGISGPSYSYALHDACTNAHVYATSGRNTYAYQ